MLPRAIGGKRTTWMRNERWSTVLPLVLLLLVILLSPFLYDLSQLL